MEGVQMGDKKITVLLNRPIMQGSISTAVSKCGKPNCACNTNPDKLHGPYWRWTGPINGKMTTRRISKEAAKECQKKIDNYKKIQKRIKELLSDGLKNAPWESNMS